MTMTAKGRADALYAVISQGANWGRLTGDEQAGTYNALLALFGRADLDYIVGAATVLPSTLQAPAGSPVSVTGSPTAQTGATTGPSPVLTGTGRLS